MTGSCAPTTGRISAAGNPVASVPAGFTPEGLPVGVQIVGRAKRTSASCSLRTHSNRRLASVSDIGRCVVDPRHGHNRLRTGSVGGSERGDAPIPSRIWPMFEVGRRKALILRELELVREQDPRLFPFTLASLSAMDDTTLSHGLPLVAHAEVSGVSEGW
jgi:hypothetical protein